MTKAEIIHIIQHYHLVPIFIVVLAFFANRLIRKYLSVYFESGAKHIKVDETRYHFIKNASTAIVMGAAIAFAFFSIPTLRSLGATIFAGAGIAAAILAFASQEAMSNIIGGIFLVIFKPIRVGDFVQIGDQYFGVVEDITLRHTIINSLENRRIIIPNSVINRETITNSNIKDNKICRFIEFGISYDSSVELARKIIQEEGIKHPSFVDNRTKKERKAGDHPLAVRMVSHGDFSIGLRAYFWAHGPVEARLAEYDLLESVKKRFDAEGIEIPFPYRTLVYKNEQKANQ